MKVNPSRFKPFMLITREDNKVVIVAGNTQMSPIEFENEEQAETYLRSQPYEMVTNMYSIFRFYEQHPEELQKQINKENNEHEETK